MSDSVSEVSVDLSDPTVVEMLLDDQDLRKLPLGSDDFKAAAVEKMAKMNANASDPAAEATEQVEGEAESDEDDVEPEAKPEQKKRKGGVEKRIDELVREREELKRRLEALESGHKPEAVEEKPAKVEAKSTFDKPKPKMSDFEYNTEAYADALTDWKLEKIEHERAAAEQKREFETKVTGLEQAWNERQEAFSETVDDYDEIVTTAEVKKLNASPTAIEYMFESEHGPQIAYQILSDDDLKKQFKAMSPTRQVAFIAKLEARFDNDEPAAAEPKAKKTIVTKAPQPAKTLPKSKAVATSKSIYDPNLSFEEYNRLMDERDRAKKKPR